MTTFLTLYEKHFPGDEGLDPQHPNFQSFLVDFLYYCKEERKSHTYPSISDVTNGILYSLSYAKKVQERRSKLYWDAKEKGEESKASIHLQYYSNARRMEELIHELQLLIEKVH